MHRSIADKSRIGLDAKKVRDTREALGLSQTEVARRVKMTPQKWNDIENGRRSNLTIETLDRIAAALGVKAKDLLK